jgi:hypothetical protein
MNHGGDLCSSEREDISSLQNVGLRNPSCSAR